MSRSLPLRLLACLCATLLTTLFPSDVQAQRKLVPVKCNAEELEYGWICLDSLFVEEGTLPPDTCERVFEIFRGLGYQWRLLFTNFRIHISFRGQDAYAAEFDELSKSRGVIDSSNAYLLDEQVRAFLAMLQDDVGFDQVMARGISHSIKLGGPFAFSCDVPNPQYYNYWKVKQLWALSRGADTTDSAAVVASQSSLFGMLHLTDPCFVLTSVENDARSSATSSPLAAIHGAIQLSGIQGRYTLYDISGRIVTQGELMQGEENRVVQVNPGVYVLLSATNARTIMVLP